LSYSKTFQFVSESRGAIVVVVRRSGGATQYFCSKCREHSCKVRQTLVVLAVRLHDVSRIVSVTMPF